MRYQKNIEQVFDVIDGFPRSCKKNFVNNLRSLRFEYLSLDELYRMVGDSTVNALYVPFHNKIYFNGRNNTDVEINHELFHVASRNNCSLGVVGDFMFGNRAVSIGKYLNEGITDYLAYKSVGKVKFNSAYQLEIFVVESLIKVYGDKIFKHYFKGDYVSFYRQFHDNQRLVIETDLLLGAIQNNLRLKYIFEEFIYLRDFKPDVLKSNGLYVEKLIGDDKELSIFNRWLLKSGDKIHKLYDIYQDDKVYTLRNNGSISIYDNWYLSYKNGQKGLFEEIIKDIIRISRNKRVDEVNIKASLVNLLENKMDALDAIGYDNKKLIRKK